ncbi:LIM/homeobox protein Lhx9-like [Galendromus occidentalis]|uniref:LIM/homeobox protein Lhx9-like n=1 Tax=Galendromus occidentalis TaxID=34638 RepID=A0AAJ7SHA2_9ACAR|nr:LIM/homeobox protein Lhx9-like [Galendromus occidentalis]
MPIMEIHPGSEVSGGSTSPGIPRLCTGCGNPICDRYFLCVGEMYWHVGCLQCAHCKTTLEQHASCFLRSGRIYCKNDYFRLFSLRPCSRCNIGIFSTELVMRVRDYVYHTHCFTCAWCNIPLSRGDTFGVRDQLVYCSLHYGAISAEGDLTTSLGPATEFEDIHETPISPQQYSPNQSPLQQQQQQQPAKKGRPRKRKIESEHELQTLQGQMECQVSPGGALSPLSSLGDKLQLSGQQRTKRMRTSFKHHQLRTMKTYFGINQNPDAKDLKQLAQKTGLSKRVLQVWFQNARAKWRRNNLRNHDPVAPMVTDSPSPVSTSNPLDFAQQQALEVTVETTFQELF